MKIPFCMTYKGLLLSGKERERARIEYEYKGEEMERNLLALDYDSDDLKKLKDYKIRKIGIDKKYGKIDDMNYELEMCKINVDGKTENELKINELDILLKYDKINRIDYYKQKNDILGKSWVAIKTSPEMTEDELEFEVEYNQTFIKKMRQRGLPGDTDKDIAEQWLKLFFIANLEEDDIKLLGVDDSYDDAESPSSVQKLDNDSLFFG